MWDSLLNEAGLTEREVRSIMVLGNNPNMRASELAKELQTTRLDAYNSLSRLQETVSYTHLTLPTIGCV